MKFSENCSPRIVLHELVHIVGFVHEQCREDRDNFVNILYENVINGTERNFDKYTFPYKVYTPYDYDSVTHYNEDAYSRNENPTIQPTKKGVRIGYHIGLSRFDIIKINKHYQCGENTTECNDILPEAECRLKGLGETKGTDGNITMDPDIAECKDKNWAEKYCPLTCGECYDLFVKTKLV